MYTLYKIFKNDEYIFALQNMRRSLHQNSDNSLLHSQKVYENNIFLNFFVSQKYFKKFPSVSRLGSSTEIMQIFYS